MSIAIDAPDDDEEEDDDDDDDDEDDDPDEADDEDFVVGEVSTFLSSSSRIAIVEQDDTADGTGLDLWQKRNKKILYLFFCLFTFFDFEKEWEM